MRFINCESESSGKVAVRYKVAPFDCKGPLDHIRLELPIDLDHLSCDVSMFWRGKGDAHGPCERRSAYIIHDALEMSYTVCQSDSPVPDMVVVWVQDRSC